MCEFCGEIAHYAYGILDKKRTEEYATFINENRNETIRNRQLIYNNTVFAESMVLYTNTTFNKVAKAINNVKDNLAKFTAEQNKYVDNMMALIKVQMINSVITMANNEHTRMHNKIRRTLENAREGKISELIPKEMIKTELTKIQPLLKPIQRLPLDPNSEDAWHIYKYSTISSILFKDKIMIEIKMPIAEREDY